jgi:hypothetical protein
MSDQETLKLAPQVVDQFWKPMVDWTLLLLSQRLANRF